MFDESIKDSHIQFHLPGGEIVSVDGFQNPTFALFRAKGDFASYLESYKAFQKPWHALVSTEGTYYRLYGDGEVERVRSTSPSLEEKLAKQPVPIQVFFRPEEDED